ncbi:hypothetical protein SODALDRAFT_361312 [Sodiomyces alkalinus F11]|uniref:Uncharacterized protein n=1 Tax=Sodiomyces alkalinus (strain CBS 110278 / VKM F-3762 / F11) TaxID=1314773 RepID=A0A3N2PSU4_SODAK|nr:hypothetical protein SODALDRAFT_361312 [Sodiomyces alkalinus F11]ROT37593.1 hypothetical protein SODALDRAFT_361312 [Sodiomyces alkalinus F11]
MPGPSSSNRWREPRHTTSMLSICRADMCPPSLQWHTLMPRQEGGIAGRGFENQSRINMIATCRCVATYKTLSKEHFSLWGGLTRRYHLAKSRSCRRDSDKQHETPQFSMIPVRALVIVHGPSPRELKPGDRTRGHWIAFALFQLQRIPYSPIDYGPPISLNNTQYHILKALLIFSSVPSLDTVLTRNGSFSVRRSFFYNRIFTTAAAVNSPVLILVPAIRTTSAVTSNPPCIASTFTPPTIRKLSSPEPLLPSIAFTNATASFPIRSH